MHTQNIANQNEWTSSVLVKPAFYFDVYHLQISSLNNSLIAQLDCEIYKSNTVHYQFWRLFEDFFFVFKLWNDKYNNCFSIPSSRWNTLTVQSITRKQQEKRNIQTIRWTWIAKSEKKTKVQRRLVFIIIFLFSFVHKWAFDDDTLE